MLKRPHLMTNGTNCSQREIKVKGQKLGTVTSFEYLGAVVLDDGFIPEALSRIAKSHLSSYKVETDFDR